MRTWILTVVVATAACGGKKQEKEAAKAALVTPKVDPESVLAKEPAKVPWLLIVDDKGARVGAAASWAELDAGDLRLADKSKPIDVLDRHIREDFAMGKMPADTVATLNDASNDGVDIDLASLEDVSGRNPSGAQDDPPPPEEEDKPDDEEESGGTGTAITLEEGKMGKKDSDRAEGQYKMQKYQEDPQLARQQAIEQARNAGILGRGGNELGSGPGFGRPKEDGMPSRLAQVTGAIPEDGKLDPLRTMILMAPAAKATKLIEAIAQTDGAIAVWRAGKIRPLRLQFMIREQSLGSSRWVEARVSTKGLVIEAVPDKAIEAGDLNPKQLASTIDQVRKARGTDDDAPVDVLVDPDVDVQRMIDVLVALDVAGVRTIGLGAAPTGEELSRRGHRIPTVALGQPNAQGDLDKSIIRRYIKLSRSKILDCYTKALADNPELAGTVQSQFFIAPTGSVAQANASGVEPEVASCIAEVIKKIEFPKPKGGGGVQVNYPFTFRP